MKHPLFNPLIFILRVLIVSLITTLLIKSAWQPVADVSKSYDALMHFLSFGGLNLLICTLLFLTAPVVSSFITPLLVIASLGFVDEIYHPLAPTMDTNFINLLSNVSGAVAATLLMTVVVKFISYNAFKKHSKIIPIA